MKITFNAIITVIATAVGVFIAILLGFVFIPLAPKNYSLTYWLFIGIGAPIAIISMAFFCFSEKENSSETRINFGEIFVISVLVILLAFAIEGIVISFLYGEVWGYIALGILAAAASPNFAGSSDKVFLVIGFIVDFIFGIVFGILLGGSPFYIIIILILALLSTGLLMSIFVKKKNPEPSRDTAKQPTDTSKKKGRISSEKKEIKDNKNH